MTVWAHHPEQLWMRRRMTFVATGLLCCMACVIGRVYYLKVHMRAELEDRRTTTERDVTYEPRRGRILDRNGAELAITVKAPSVYANPRRISKPEQTIAALAPLLKLSPEELRKKLNKKRAFVWLARKIHPEQAAAISALKLEGVHIKDEHKRFYPQGDVAGQIVGFVGMDNKGLEGLERSFNRTLTGESLKIQGTRDASGRMMLTGQTPQLDALEGESVQLTIDEQLQRVAQRALTDQVDKYKAKGGYAIVLDVATGEVLALANTPRFDPNRFRDHTSEDWRLRPVTDTFEPGSVIKPLVLAAALQERGVKLHSTFDCEKGRIKIGRYTIRDSHPNDTLTAAQIVQQSSNIGAYKIAQTIGPKALHRYLKAFGFGQRTGLGVRGEQPGLVWPSERWAEVSFANIAFGQGFTSTPLQVAQSVAAIANGGMMLEPRLIRAVVGKDGKPVKRFEPRLVRQIVSPDVARRTAWAMSLVTTEEGTAKQAAMEPFTVAGKTGTAQKVNPKTRRYDPRMWVASFVGFFPAERPRVVIAVMIDEPHKIHYGGTVAAPVFKRIAEEAISVLGLLPVPEAERFDLTASTLKLRGQSAATPAPEPVASKKKDKLKGKDTRPSAGDAPADEAADSGAPPLTGDLLDHVTPQGDGVVMPRLEGLTLRQALHHTRQLGVLPDIQGWGRVTAQHPAPGEVWRPGQAIRLELAPATHSGLVADEPSTGSAP